MRTKKSLPGSGELQTASTPARLELKIALMGSTEEATLDFADAASLTNRSMLDVMPSAARNTPDSRNRDNIETILDCLEEYLDADNRYPEVLVTTENGRQILSGADCADVGTLLAEALEVARAAGTLAGTGDPAAAGVVLKARATFTAASVGGLGAVFAGEEALR